MKIKFILISIILIISNSALFSQTGQLKGKITNAVTNESIPFANVVIYGTNTVSTSDLDGNFIFTGLKPGYIKLQAKFIGFKLLVSDDILITNSTPAYIELKINPEDAQLNKVVITGDYFKNDDEAPVSMQNIGIREIESNPGSNRDISKVIQSFPGVGSTPAFRNDVIIRGGGPSENRFFLDGVEIPVLNHFSTQGASGGPVGIINADFIRSVNFYSGSFPADKYNALSGVLDFKLKEGSVDKTNFQATLGASETALTIDGPIDEKTNYIFSVRRSYLQFLFSAIGLPFLPTYNDYQLKLKTNINQKNTLTIISLGSLDKNILNTSIKNPTESQEYILSNIPVNYQWSYTFGAVYKHFFKNGYHTFVASRNMLNNQFYKYPDNDETREKSLDYKSTEAENKLRYELDFRKNDYKFNFSLNGEYAKYYNETSQKLFISDSLIDFNYLSRLEIFKYGLSGQVSKKYFKDKLLLSFGIRADANNYNDNTINLLNQLSPRFAASYSIFYQTSINFGVGRYFQQPAYTTLGFRNFDGIYANSETAKYIGANHINLGIEKRFSDKAILSLEGFYKDYFQYPIDKFTGASLANQGADYSGIAGAGTYNFIGQGKAVGFEVLNRLNFKKFKLLASYTFVRSLFTDINGDFIPSSWDSKHLLTITGSKDFEHNWRVGFKWRFVGGLPYTPYDLQTSSYVKAWDTRGQAYLDFSQFNTLRFNAFHQLDLRIDKNFFFKKWSLMAYIDVQNAYNFQNKNQDYIIREKNSDGTYKTINNGTQYVLKAVPSISGTVLPSVGIMVKF